MNEYVNNNIIRELDPANYRGAKDASGNRFVIEETSRLKYEDKSPQPIPFNGLLTNKLLAALPGTDFARLLPYLEPVSLHSGEHLYKFGAEIDFAYFPETAVVSHVYFLEDGSTTGAAIVGNDGIIGLSAIFDSQALPHWTQVTVGGSALRVGMDFIKEAFGRGGALQQLVLGYAGARLAQLSQRAVCNGSHRLDARLCTWLLMIHDRAGGDPLPLTHEEISDYLGARRAGITSICKALRDNGSIHYRRGIIRILDRQMLEAAACECYRTLRQLFEQPRELKSNAT